MRLTFLLLATLVFVTSYAQGYRVIVYTADPNWDNNASAIIRKQNIISDSVYFYKKKKNNKDSVLIMTEYFDSSGNLIEREDHGFDGKMFRITNYIYADTELLKKESISLGVIYVNGSNTSKMVETYDHDSLGNITDEKEYSYFGDSLNSIPLHIWKKEYDITGHIAREFVTLPGGKTYLHQTYAYDNGNLREIKNYDFNQNWMYTYLYEFDAQTGTRSEYSVYNTSRVLKHEFLYDGQKRLIEERDYDQGHAFLDHITQNYFYSPVGLVESQTMEDLSGKNYYFKHFYSK